MRAVRVASSGLTALAVAGPSQAWGQSPGAKLGIVFGDASPEMKLIIAGLWAASVAAVVVWALAAARLGRMAERPPRASRALGFLSALRIAGPLLGLAGLANVLGHAFVALMIQEPARPMIAMAPAYAEAAVIASAGLTAGVVAAIAHASLAVMLARRQA